MDLKAYLDANDNDELNKFIAAQDYSSIASWLNAPTYIENPDPAPLISVPIEIEDLIKVLKPPEISTILTIGKFNEWAANILDGTIPVLLTSQKERSIELSNQIISALLANGRPTGEKNFIEALTEVYENRMVLAAIAELLAITGAIGPETLSTLQSAMAATMTDPNHPDKIATPSISGQNEWGSVTASDVQGALN